MWKARGHTSGSLRITHLGSESPPGALSANLFGLAFVFYDPILLVNAVDVRIRIGAAGLLLAGVSQLRFSRRADTHFRHGNSSLKIG